MRFGMPLFATDICDTSEHTTVYGKPYTGKNRKTRQLEVEWPMEDHEVAITSFYIDCMKNISETEYLIDRPVIRLYLTVEIIDLRSEISPRCWAKLT